jgi:hypothetical protein
MNIADLPQECLMTVLDFIRLDDFYSFIRTNSVFYSIMNNEEAWHKLYLNRLRYEMTALKQQKSTQNTRKMIKKLDHLISVNHSCKLPNDTYAAILHNRIFEQGLNKLVKHIEQIILHGIHAIHNLTYVAEIYSDVEHMINWFFAVHNVKDVQTLKKLRKRIINTPLRGSTILCWIILYCRRIPLALCKQETMKFFESAIIRLIKEYKLDLTKEWVVFEMAASWDSEAIQVLCEVYCRFNFNPLSTKSCAVLTSGGYVALKYFDTLVKYGVMQHIEK